MKSALSMAFIVTLALVGVLIVGAEASDLANCAKMKNDAERLACYDLLAEDSQEKKTSERDAESNEAAEREKIISRCRKEMAEYGSAMIKYCAEEDIAAYRALQSYPAELRPLVERCNREMGGYGWSMVKYCADEDIDAERALNDMLAD